MKTRHTLTTVAATLVVCCPLLAQVPMWERFETTVTNTRSYANPFADVTLTATFTRPSGSTVPFWGFYDGDGQGGQTGHIWKLRFMPDEVGEWRYTCVFSDGAPGAEGTFRCVQTSARPGPLRVDPDNPHWFIFADGSRKHLHGYQGEWFNPVDAAIPSTEPIALFDWQGGGRKFRTPVNTNSDGLNDWVLHLWSATSADRAGLRVLAAPAIGPLRVHPTNPRYFTDDGQRAIYLTGSHTWANLIDRGPNDPPPAFDFNAYLDLLERHHHNFIRLWGRHVSWYHDYGEGELHAAPLAWSRTGPGTALDGKPKFDLTRLDQAYFDRLRARVMAARNRGIYVGVMLFGGHYECHGGWRGNPFNGRNNINGINGDPSGDGVGLEAHTLAVPEIARFQEAYVRKVIDTVNDLDNVLYEISNEGDRGSFEWQAHLVRFIRGYEAELPKQHPVGITALWVDDPFKGNQRLLASPADWIAPQVTAEGVGSNLAAADGSKVSLIDSDHWFVKELYRNPVFGCEWVWKAFCRGHNPILMEHLAPISFVDGDYPLTNDDPGYLVSRRAMGQTRRLTERMNLASMTPRGDLASSGYCLANRGHEYVVYAPRDGEITVDLAAVSGLFAVEWLHPVEGSTTSGAPIQGGQKRSLRGPFAGDAVLYLQLERSGQEE